MDNEELEKEKEAPPLVDPPQPEAPINVQEEPIPSQTEIKSKNSSNQVMQSAPLVTETLEEEEGMENDFDNEEFDGISDGDEDDDDSDGLLIPLENGWVCEKRLADSRSNSYSTHFWSPDGHRHSSLTSIKSYGTKKKLKLNMTIFERALKNNPHK